MSIVMILGGQGCGYYGEVAKLYPATGTVTIDGKPQPNLNVEYQATNGTVAFGLTDSSGHFELSVPQRGVGVPAGIYTVKVRGDGVPLVYDENGAALVEVSELQNAPAKIELKSKATAKDVKFGNEAAE